MSDHLRNPQPNAVTSSRTQRRSRHLGHAVFVIVAVQLGLLLMTVLRPERLMALFGAADWGSAQTWGIVGVQLIGLFLSLVVLWRVALVSRYRIEEDVGDWRLPLVTVLVPAYNEGRQVLSTLRSIAHSRYPAGRLEIIAIDDGSQDDTWSWIRRGEAELSGLVKAVRCAKNGGKKHALAQGVRRARGEVIVTLDSDSEVLPDTVRLLVAPLVTDPGCGAVAGNVRVLNRHEGMLPRMLDACFTASFDFGRAAESMVGGVMCCPGALSAWRTQLFRDNLDTWLAQTFFGQPAAIGEDRALTNLVLRSGHTVRYQSNAIVLTQVPTNAKTLCRMFLRWGRSNVRESIVMAGFVFRLRTLAGRPMRGLRVLYVGSVLSTLVSAALFLPLVVMLVARPTLLPLYLLVTAIAALPNAAINLAARDLRTSLWALPWGLYSMVVTTWIPLWALLSMHRSGWLTRGAPALAPQPVHLSERSPAKAA